MNLLKPLALPDANTSDVSLVPTKKFFKMVLVIEAPCTPDQADLLGLGWLFDQASNPREFGGTVKAVGELPQAEITLAAKTIPALSIRTERVAHVSMARIEKHGMILTARIHLPELKAKKLVELLEFLSTINKESFELVITPAQRTIFEGGAFEKDENGLPLPNAEGMYDANLATLKPYDNKFVVATLATLEVPGGFIGGWNCRISGKLPKNEGEALHRDRELFGAESLALEAAAKSAIAMVDRYLTEADDTPSLTKARGAVLDYKSFLIGFVPIGEGAHQ